MPKQSPWQIRVGRKADVLAEFCVPAHKMDVKDLKTFLRALVVRYRTNSPEDMVGYYVNRRRGHPCRLPFAEVTYQYWPDQCRGGYWCGDWECYASATREIDASAAKALKELMRASKAAC